MELVDIRLVSKLSKIGLRTKKYRTYKKQLKRINPILRANGRKELKVNSKKKIDEKYLRKLDKEAKELRKRGLEPFRDKLLSELEPLCNKGRDEEVDVMIITDTKGEVWMEIDSWEYYNNEYDDEIHPRYMASNKYSKYNPFGHGNNYILNAEQSEIIDIFVKYL
ncbi:hypothetical protein FDB61_15655 [Clostridium botulinum]|nr:hypothetical protein [Clostridium botulinum]